MTKNKLGSIRNCKISAEEHKERTCQVLEVSKNFYRSITEILDKKSKLKKDLQKTNFPLIEKIKENNNFALETDKRWKDLSFGPVGTMEKSGCLIYTAYNMLYLMGIEVSIEELRTVALEKGYRLWRFANSNVALDWSEITLEKIKEKFDDKNVQKATSIEEAEKVLGMPVGIGGSGYFIDEVISLYTGNIPYYQTRVFNWGQMLKNLSNGIPVPVRVQNSIFRNDESRLGGHYVNLIGFKEKMAITVDSATEGGIYKLPVEQFLKSLIYEAVMISVWNASK